MACESKTNESNAAKLSLKPMNMENGMFQLFSYSQRISIEMHDFIKTVFYDCHCFKKIYMHDLESRYINQSIAFCVFNF